jgi:hypothetical protein
MLSEYPLEMKRTLHNQAKPAPETPERKGILFLEILKKGILKAISAGNAGLEGCFILNVRKGISLISSSQQLGCTPPLFRHFRHPRFFNLNLQIHNL